MQWKALIAACARSSRPAAASRPTRRRSNCSSWQSGTPAFTGTSRLNGRLQSGSLPFCSAIVLSPQRAEGSKRWSAARHTQRSGHSLERYKKHGLEALTDRSRRPVRYANQLPRQIESLIVAAKRDKPHWGARKIRELLVRRLDGDIRVPAKSTIHAVLHRHGLVKVPGRPRHRATGTPLSTGAAPNELWCADFKGEFKLGNGQYCFPLTVTDHASRYLLLCEALESTRENLAITAFEQLFQERGLPQAIRSDNGVPFASPNGLFNLSKLSVWWLRLGVAIERIKPGHPQQNGRHERMHLTLKKETTRPPGSNSLQQQERFDVFVREFNAERPHEALDMKCPAELYLASPRPYDGLPELIYPFHDREVLVTACGR